MVQIHTAIVSVICEVCAPFHESFLIHYFLEITGFTFKKSTFNVVGTPNPIEPPRESCLTKNYIITEISNPANVEARYIEVYNAECAGKYIEDRISLCAYKHQSSQREIIKDLQHVKIPDDGFLIFCKNKALTNAVYGEGTCDIEIGSLDDLGSTGKVSYAIYDEPGYLR